MKTEYYDFHGKCSISSETLNRGFTPAAVAPPECDKLLDTCYIIIALSGKAGRGTGTVPSFTHRTASKRFTAERDQRGNHGAGTRA